MKKAWYTLCGWLGICLFCRECNDCLTCRVSECPHGRR